MQDVRVDAGGRTDWEAVYRAEAPSLWRSLVLQTGSPEVAADAVAEAFAQGIARGDAIRKPGAWVWRTAFVIARAEAGRLRADPHADQNRTAVGLESMVELFDDLRTLSPMQRSAIVLHYFAGYSLAETAAIVGSTRSAVGVHLFRARKKLRDGWENDHEP